MAIPLAGSPNQAALIGLSPSANISGSNNPQPPLSGGGEGTAIGGKANPFLPPTTSGQSMPPVTASGGGFPANTGGSTTGLGGTNPSDLFGGTLDVSSIAHGLKQSGIPGNVATLLAEFLKSGAGFNPQVAQALINALGPSISRGKADIMEQFGSAGLADSSAAAIGLGDFESQVNLDIDKIFAGLYEQSVQNYLSILMGTGKKKQSGWDTFLQSFAGSAGEGLGSLLFGG